MKVPFSFGGGSSADSNECTAEASDVLESKTAIYLGSDDEPAYGTMKDYSGTTTSASVTNNSSNSRVELTVPNTGKYDTSAKLYGSYSNIASVVSLTADKIATGTTVMGVTGTYTGLGSATEGQVLSGKTFSTASLSNASGTMTDKSGTSTAATSSLVSPNFRLQVPTTGYYNTSAYLTNSYSNTASTIGLTAAKLKYGESVLGITGTWNGYVSGTEDLYNTGTAGSTAGSITLMPYTLSGYTVSLDGSYITISRTSGSSGGGHNGFYITNSLNMAAYTSKITLTYTIVTVPTSTVTEDIELVIYREVNAPSSVNTGDYFEEATSTLVGKTANTSYTLSVDVSNLYRDCYVGVFVYNQGSSSQANYEVRVTRIQIS